MNYIYDILINFQPDLYDIYDWNKNDNILHLRKIPLFRVSTEILKALCNDKVTIDSEFLIKIMNRTELFGRNKVTPLEYCFLATDKKEVVGYKLDKFGNIIGYSKLLLEEELEVLEYAQGLSNYPISYEVIGHKELRPFNTREELKMKKFIMDELHKMIRNQDDDKLLYLYLECFEQTPDIEQLSNTIFDKIEQQWDKVYLKLYQFLKMTASRR